MALWLFKDEPSEYSFADLVREGQTLWDGVSNALALIHLRNCRPGDRAFFYHTGREKAVVGIMEITGPPRPDPAQKNEKLVVVPVRPVQALARPVALAEIKADPLFADWELIRIGRLSVMPCSVERWKRIEEMASAGAGPSAQRSTAVGPPAKGSADAGPSGQRSTAVGRPAKGSADAGPPAKSPSVRVKKPRKMT